MIIKTQYDVGHTFWAPRSTIMHEVEELQFEGETWKRNVQVYKSYAKHKEIIGIDIRVNIKGKLNISYSVVSVNDYSSVSQHYSEADIVSYSEEEALEIAKEYAEQKLEYYGMR